MRKNILFLLLASLFSLKLLSQDFERQKIDSFRKLVTSLRGVSRIDCLNALAQSMSNVANYEWKNHELWNLKADSIFNYATLAYEEANKIDYMKGIAMALTNQARSEYMRGVFFRLVKKSDDISALNGIDKYLSKAIPIAEQINDHETLGYAFSLLAVNQIAKTKFTNSLAGVESSKKAIEHLQKSGNSQKEGEECNGLAEIYISAGEYEKAIDFSRRALQINYQLLGQDGTKDQKDWRNYMYLLSLLHLAQLYVTAGDFETALDYYKACNRFADVNNPNYKWVSEQNLAEIFRLTGQIDSSFYYLRKVNFLYQNNPWFNVELGKTYVQANEFDSAIIVLHKALEEFEQGKYIDLFLPPALLSLGNAYAGNNNYSTAIRYARQGTAIALKRGMRPELMQGYQLFSSIHRHLGNPDSAYEYLLKYTNLKDSIQNRQFLFRLNNYKKEAEEQRKTSQINLLNKDNQLKAQKLKQQATVRNGLVGGILLLFLLGVFIVRNLLLKRNNEKLTLEKNLELHQLESEKKQAEFQQKAAELEMQALRAQMNPHFIFNCLSSINRFIFKNDNKLASDYLTRFSRLIRMVLMNSSKKLTTLEDELEMLRLYLDLERLRFKDAFDYSITTTNIVDAGAIFIPPLLLQPFCENAVWHGLMHKETKGHLNVNISEVTGENDKTLHCVIEDDGIGRSRAAELRSKSAESEKSMGLKITSERLALLNQENNFSTFYKIEDVLDEDNEVTGTRVEIKIKYIESIEETILI